MKRILLVTGNRGKLDEVRRIVQAKELTGFDIDSVDVDLKELQGEPLDVAIAKCLEAKTVLDEKKIPYDGVLIEDTCLCFTALGGLPGVFIKWFEKKLGLNGLVNMLAAYEDKSCYAQCTFALAFPSSKGKESVQTFVGQTFGRIVSPRYHVDGSKGFGWGLLLFFFCVAE